MRANEQIINMIKKIVNEGKTETNKTHSMVNCLIIPAVKKPETLQTHQQHSRHSPNIPLLINKL